MARASLPPAGSPHSNFHPRAVNVSGQVKDPQTSNYLPTQQSLGSVGHFMSSSTNATFTPSHVISKEYVEQHRAFVQHQRQLHDEERRLWELERRELHQRVSELEEIVRQLGGQVESNFFAPHDQSQLRGSPLESHSAIASQVSSTIGSGDEFWRGAGGKSNAQPTRTFSESSERSPAASAESHQLFSISEESQRPSVGFDRWKHQDFHVHPIPSVSREIMAASFDGISFKPNPLPPALTRSLSTSSQNPSLRSACGSPIPSRAASKFASTSILSAGEQLPIVVDPHYLGSQPSELLVRDAGHTPLSRLTENTSDTFSPKTPVKSMVDEARPQLADSAPDRPPTERCDSYFPPPVEPKEELRILVADPPLREPLALKGDPESRENESFLSELDTKLLEIKRSDSPDGFFDTSDKAEVPRKVHSANVRLGDDQPRSATDEAEPKLRIKRSMNFGSLFGSSNVGRL